MIEKLKHREIDRHPEEERRRIQDNKKIVEILIDWTLHFIQSDKIQIFLIITIDN